MNYKKRTAWKLLTLALIDQIVTVVVVARGDQFALYFNYAYYADNYADSLLELWIFSLLRLAVYIGVTIAIIHDMRKAVSRFPIFTKVYSVFLCLFISYSLAKLLIFSELTYFTESMRLGFVIATVIWNFVMCIVAYVTFSGLAQLHTRFRKFARRQNRAGRRDEQQTSSVVNETSDGSQLLGQRENGVNGLFSSWISDNRTVDSDSESEEEAEDASLPSQTNSQPKRSNVIRLLEQMRNDLPLVILATCFLVIAAVGEAVAPLFTSRVVNAIVIERSYEAFGRAIWSMLGLSAVSTLFAGGRAWLMTVCMYRVQLRLRARLFASLVRQELAFFDRTPTGDVVSRLTTDASTVGSLITLNFNIFLRTSIKAVGLCGFMFYFSWRLSLLTVFAMSIFAVLANICGEYYEKLSKLAQDALAKANAVADEVLSTMRTVRSFANEMGEARLYAWKLEKAYTINCMEAVVYAVLMVASQLYQQLLLTVILFYGGHLVFSGLLAASDLVSFMLYQMELGDCLSSITDAYTGIIQALGASSKLFELMDRKPAIAVHYQDSEGTQPERFEGRIELRNVDFGYPTRQEKDLVLKNVSFTVAPGEIVALVGKSGSGKSSIVGLIEHFYEPLRGQVLIDGRDVRDYNHRYIHTKMALVSQEPVLYGRSVRDNIAYALDLSEKNRGNRAASANGSASAMRKKKEEEEALASAFRQTEFRYGFSLPDGLTCDSAAIPADIKTCTTDAEVMHCAELSNAASFITDMRRGYDTYVGEKGCTISGGQKQRVAIARALIREPKILLLDEATSALDTESEALVQQAIYRNVANRTVLIVAHRLSTIERADRIVVLDKGVVIETGSHQELLALDGVYAHLVRRQLLKEQQDHSANPSSSAPQNLIQKQQQRTLPLPMVNYASRNPSQIHYTSLP